VIRSEWNAGAAAAWGFADQAAVEAAIEAALNPPTPEQDPTLEGFAVTTELQNQDTNLPVEKVTE
jgi:hypothetical protein